MKNGLVRILGDKRRLTCESIITSRGVTLDVSGSPLRIGKHVSIRHDAIVYTHTHQFHKPDWRDLGAVTTDVPTVIDDYAFVGTRAIILHSCKRVGRHSVVGAGSVVVCDIPDHEIWAGNPAVKIGDVDADKQNSPGGAV